MANNPQFPTGDILRLGLLSGDPSAYQQSNQNESRLFGLALMDLLKQYQGLEKYPFRKQEFGAQQKQINRSIATDPGLIGASPGVQSSVRNAGVEALQPTVSGARQSGQTFASQLGQFSDVIGTGISILKEQAAQQDKERDDARNLVNQALTTFGSKGVEIIDAKYWKLAGYDEKSRQKVRDTLKEQELELKAEKQRMEAALKAGSDGVGGLTSQQAGWLNTVQDNARQDANIKEFTNVRASYEQAVSSAAKGTGAGDIVLMRTIAKITDPSSSVREEEFKTFQGAQSVLARYGVAITKQWWQGSQLSAYGRQQLLEVARDLYTQRKSAYDNSVNFYNNQLKQMGIPDTFQAIPYYQAPNGPTNNFSKLDELFNKQSQPVIESAPATPRRLFEGTKDIAGNLLNWLTGQ